MKIICVQNNYASSGAVLSAAPSFYIKPDSALLQKNQPFFYPDFSSEIACGLELVVKINRLGKNIQSKFAHKYYSEVALALNFTALDVLAEAKANGNPWTMATGFDNSAAISPFVDLAEIGKGAQDVNFQLKKDDQIILNGSAADMLHSVNDIVAYVSQFMTLKIGDYIFTGSPMPAEKVVIDNSLEASLEGKTLLHCRIK
ncbi:MAG: fumarylacetoacetate hydrolase family protein [Bacteroidales bacterium]|nr:fumarylacetoacetate hydrolase family protein [Bacteroidales bacterium]